MQVILVGSPLVPAATDGRPTEAPVDVCCPPPLLGRSEPDAAAAAAADFFEEEVDFLVTPAPAPAGSPGFPAETPAFGVLAPILTMSFDFPTNPVVTRYSYLRSCSSQHLFRVLCTPHSSKCPTQKRVWTCCVAVSHYVKKTHSLASHDRPPSPQCVAPLVSIRGDTNLAAWEYDRTGRCDDITHRRTGLPVLLVLPREWALCRLVVTEQKRSQPFLHWTEYKRSRLKTERD